MTTTPDNYLDVLDRVCRDVVAANASAVDALGAYPVESMAALRDAGLLGAVSAPEVGGLGLEHRGAAAIVERIATECGSTAMVTCMHFCGTAVLEQYADESTRRDAALGSHLSTLAFSEMGSRSHFWAPTGTATRAGDEVTLNARKSWVTSASRATAYVWSSRPYGAEGASTLWLVPADADGLTIQEAFDGLGLRGNDSSPVTAENVRVPLTARLGEDGEGFNIMLGAVLPLFNVLSSACSLGMMEASVQRAAQHASRTRFDHSDSTLADLPTIRNYLGRIRVDIDGVRGLLADTLSALEEGRSDATLRVLECKAAAGETSTQVLDTAMRVCGGAAFRKEGGIERYFRDCRAATVMGPTTDVLYDFIGKAVCGQELF